MEVRSTGEVLRIVKDIDADLYSEIATKWRLPLDYVEFVGNKRLEAARWLNVGNN
jgi:hypothetical protein